MKPVKILFLFSPVGPIGSGKGGGVEITLKNISKGLVASGHDVTVLAASGSVLEEAKLITVDGNFQTSAEKVKREEPTEIPANSLLANMMHFAHKQQGDYQLIVNFCYDWLPYYLTPFFNTRFIHYVNMSSQTNVLDRVIIDTACAFPKQVAMQSKAQAESFKEDFPYFFLKKGFDLSPYSFSEQFDDAIAWAGRVIPEKGVEDAFYVANELEIPLRIMGIIGDEVYWNRLRHDFPNVKLEYLGFLDTDSFQRELGKCKALLMPHKWIEAFGNVAIEALACGVPVVSYNRGAPAEFIRDGKTGFVVEADNLEQLVQKTSLVHTISRESCRKYVEENHSLAAMVSSFEEWMSLVIN